MMETIRAFCRRSNRILRWPVIILGCVSFTVNVYIGDAKGALLDAFVVFFIIATWNSGAYCD